MAIVPFDGTIDRFLERMSDLAGGSDWTPVAEFASLAPNFQVESQDLEGDRFLRTQFEYDMSLQQTVLCLRPESVFHSSRPEFDEKTLECDIEELHAPGDATAWLVRKLNAPESPSMKRGIVGALVSAVAGRCGDFQRVMDAAVREDEGVMQRFRMVTRRDCPKDGLMAGAFIPRHLETGALLDQFGVMTSLAIFLEPVCAPWSRF